MEGRIIKEQQDNFVPATDQVVLTLNKAGETVAIISGKEHVIGQIMSVFPITTKYRYVSVRDEQGIEIAIIEGAGHLDGESSKILRRELERSYFLPKITDIYSVDDHLGLLTFSVETDRGPRAFEARNPRQNVRSVGRGRYIIKDVDGNRYDIPALQNLGPRSQNLMAEFV